MSELTSPQGSIELAITALLLVLAYRLARPARPREWAGLVAYAGGLAGQLLGAAGLLRGVVYAPGAAPRILGAVALVAGLALAGAPARARRRAMRIGTLPTSDAAVAAVPAGLAFVLLGQILRSPSTGGFVAVGIGIAVNAWAALAVWRRAAA